MGTFRREKGRKEQNSSTREKTREDRNVAGKRGKALGYKNW